MHKFVRVTQLKVVKILLHSHWGPRPRGHVCGYAYGSFVNYTLMCSDLLFCECFGLFGFIKTYSTDTPAREFQDMLSISASLV